MTGTWLALGIYGSLDHGRPNPATDTPRTVENDMHHARRVGRRLHVVQTFVGVGQTVSDGFGEWISLCERAKVERVGSDQEEDTGILYIALLSLVTAIVLGCMGLQRHGIMTVV
jgi:hypothetical protein